MMTYQEMNKILEIFKKLATEVGKISEECNQRFMKEFEEESRKIDKNIENDEDLTSVILAESQFKDMLPEQEIKACLKQFKNSLTPAQRQIMMNNQTKKERNERKPQKNDKNASFEDVDIFLELADKKY